MKNPKISNTTLITLSDNAGYKVEIKYCNDEFVIVDRYIHSNLAMSLSEVTDYKSAKRYYKSLLKNGWEITNVIYL